MAEVAGSTDPTGRRGPVRSAEAEQGLKRRHGLAPAIVTEDELVEVDGKLGTADAMIGANQPLLEVANGPIGERHHRGDASVQVTAQGLRPGDVPKPRRRQPGERLQPVRIESRARGDVLLEKTGDGGRLEVANHAHADTSCPAAPLLDGHQHEGGPPAFELAGLPRSPGCGPPVQVSSTSMVPCNGSRAAFTMARRSLWSISHAVSLRRSPSWRCSPTAEIPRVSVVIRYAAQNHWAPRGKRDLMPATRALPPAPVDEHIRVPAPTALTQETVRPTARRQILFAGVFGGELALKLTQTLGEGRAGHTPTLHIGVC